MKPDGTIANSRVLLDVTSMTKSRQGLPDGMKIDSEGNLFATGPGGVLIISPQGKHLGTILLPELGANVEFGDHDRKTLYIAARTSIYKIRTKICFIGIAAFAMNNSIVDRP